MRRHIVMSVIALASSFLITAVAEAKDQVKITSKMMSARVKHQGKTVTIKRNQNQKNLVKSAFAKTSRQCPPFCIQPAIAAPGVETVAELEVINHIQQAGAAESVMLVDVRTPEWNRKGTIPTAVNIPFTALVADKGANDVTIAEALETFGATETDSGWEFSQAKTLILFCNGMWCGQSQISIKALLQLGYPAEKLKWYRNGMQDWEILSLSTIKP